MSIFGSVVMSDEKKEQCNQISQAAQKIYELIDAVIADPSNGDYQVVRYKALAKTELEASVMWACKAVSRS